MGVLTSKLVHHLSIDNVSLFLLLINFQPLIHPSIYYIHILYRIRYQMDLIKIEYGHTIRTVNINPNRIRCHERMNFVVHFEQTIIMNNNNKFDWVEKSQAKIFTHVPSIHTSVEWHIVDVLAACILYRFDLIVFITWNMNGIWEMFDRKKLIYFLVIVVVVVHFSLQNHLVPSLFAMIFSLSRCSLLLLCGWNASKLKQFPWYEFQCMIMKM